MPEAAGSSSAAQGACRLVTDKAGSPPTGSPLLRLVPATACLLAILAIALAACPQTARAGKADSESAAAKTASHAAAAKPGTGGFGEAEAAQAADPALRQELTQISQEFAAAVTDKTLARFGHKAGQRRLDLLTAPGQAYRDAVRADALGKLREAGADLSFSQYFVYADRNPGAQLLILAFYDAAAERVVLLGADFISSGKLRPGEDSFITPLGVFENLPENWGFRAQGSKNSKGWRGLGARGSRVWDFGYQQAPRQFRQGVYDSQMRLLMHATDPDLGEPRLGGPDSKGCVRVSAAANAFLDRRSILDRHYEQIARTDKERDLWLLRPDRAPVSLPGSYLVVGDLAQGRAAR